jgi:hypothetical protein
MRIKELEMRAAPVVTPPGAAGRMSALGAKRTCPVLTQGGRSVITKLEDHRISLVRLREFIPCVTMVEHAPRHFSNHMFSERFLYPNRHAADENLHLMWGMRACWYPAQAMTPFRLLVRQSSYPGGTVRVKGQT